MLSIKAKNNIKSFFTPNIIASVISVFVIRFLLSFLPSFQVDMGTWIAWAARLSDLGLSNFYSDVIWTQYTPGYLYWLWFVGKIGWLSPFAIKIPVIFADIVTAGLIWILIGKVNKKIADYSFFLYVLNPLVIFDGSVWGQIDGILTLFLFSSVYLLVEKKNYFLSWIFAGISLLIKPQSIALIPFLTIITFQRFGFKKTLLSLIVTLTTIVAGSILFFPNNPFFGFFGLVGQMGAYYSFTSLFAFNFWTLAGGMWKPDSQLFLNLTLFHWGAILSALSLGLVFLKFRNKLSTNTNVYLVFALSFLTFYLFPTRVHERYLFPAFAFFLTYAGLKNQKSLYGLFGLSSILYVLNLYHPYSYYETATNILKNIALQDFTANIAPLIAVSFIATYLLLYFWDNLPLGKILDEKIDKLIKNRNSGKLVVEEKLSKNPLSKKTTKIVLILIILFSFITRIYEIGNPPKDYFDEIYHAFTARIVLHGDPKAWEWWNPHPEGFAYEWTHPPLSKLIMAGSMKLFGEDAMGWRIPQAIFGTLSVYLVYLLTKRIFKDDLLAIFAAFIFSLDGLGLVLSRMAMNDIYVLFFMLGSIYFFLDEKDFLSSISFGLAIASKWSAIWTLPILFILWLRRKNKLNISILWFLVLPVAVYLITYVPMFLTGHDLGTWWGMQQQMWWYHTGLRATHPYTSPWWSWTLNLRPVYLYTSDEINGMVSRIYAIGNPFIFWSGIVSILTCLLYAKFERNKKLGLIVFSYVIFFVPWAASPRIMFLYHYLPSIPFMCMAIAYVLRRNLKMAIPYFAIALSVFIYFYPHWAGLNIPLWLDRSYYWLTSWR